MGYETYVDFDLGRSTPDREGSPQAAVGARVAALRGRRIREPLMDGVGGCRCAARPLLRVFYTPRPLCVPDPRHNMSVEHAAARHSRGQVYCTLVGDE